MPTTAPSCMRHSPTYTTLLIRLSFMLISVTIICLSLSGTTLYSHERAECVLCGMWIDQNEHTRHMIRFEDDSTVDFCSFACLAKYLKNNHKKITRIEAADFLTTRMINVYNAYYLEGSDVPGVMSNISRIAFLELSAIKKFQKKHGGRIVSFKRALKNELY
uniref:Uncharacterized protein n=1 Tax=uncultured Nitrospirae bacterium MY2-3C TaxID=798577 RepID=D9MP01_9BACT|nr:hypothetical protein LW2_0150 [uncultured Nitrospirae bacterium MY2-3C]